MPRYKSRKSKPQGGPLCIGLPPVIGKKPHTLILGSMLGVKSLEQRQYYAHPQNTFWKIMGVLFHAPINTYEQRLAIIKNNRLVLWDTLKCCIRPGSLDAEIDDASIEVNDFVGLLKNHPEITRVFFNGSKSESVFKKWALPSLNPAHAAKIRFTRLPSTSPAHAGRSYKQKLANWRLILK